jgi:hypothetical protein
VLKGTESGMSKERPEKKIKEQSGFIHILLGIDKYNWMNFERRKNENGV